VYRSGSRVSVSSDMNFRAEKLGLMGRCLGLRVWGLGVRVQDLGLRSLKYGVLV
jgi:hypothetical protein